MTRITKRSLVLALGLLALLAASIATSIAGAAGEGRDVNAGERNPAGGNLVRETQIIASNTTYGTRQSNKSSRGGGAIYGCRSGEGGTPTGNKPCVRANNLVNGLAFEFASSAGPVIGTIMGGKGGDGVKPFITNATGVATGLNADEVDGKSADDFLAAKDGKAADSDKLDGKDSTDFAGAGDLLFAAVTAAGAATGRGATSASVVAATNTFTVTFNKDVSKCSFTATETGGTASNYTFAVAPVATDGKSVTVDENNDGAAAVPFHLQVIC